MYTFLYWHLHICFFIFVPISIILHIESLILEPHSTERIDWRFSVYSRGTKTQCNEMEIVTKIAVSNNLILPRNHGFMRPIRPDLKNKICFAVDIRLIISDYSQQVTMHVFFGCWILLITNQQRWLIMSEIREIWLKP